MASLIGKRLPRLDAVDKATGQQTYCTDLRLPGMLHGKLLRSPYPHARIIGIDTTGAEAVPGVRAVITARDVPENNVGITLKDEPVLARGKVRYIGEPVAAVAAGDEETAEKALQAIVVEYEELPAVFTPQEAIQPGAPLIHEGLGSYRRSAYVARYYNPASGTNICNHYRLRHGDVEQGFREADEVFEDVFTAHMVQHCYMEPHAALASVSPAGQVTVWTNAQRVFDIRATLAEVFELPLNQVRVIGTKSGGGFGGKIAPKLEPVCVALSRKAQRPVRMVLARSEEFLSCGGRHPATIRIKTGVNRDGTLIAREMEIFWDTGAYTELGISVSSHSGLAAPGPYRIPHVKTDSYLVYTNKVSATAYRGLGMPKVTWAVESQMDIIAHRLGLDPLEFRLKNIMSEGDTAYFGEVLHSVGLRQCLLQAAQAIGWGKPRSGPYRGRGLACLHKFSAAGTASSAIIRVNADGTVALLSGASDLGQGADSVLAQIAAEELGLTPSEVSVTLADTEATPFDHGAFSSRITFNAGNAVLRAAADARGQLLELAASLLHVPPQGLVLRDRRISLREAPEVGVPLAEVAAASHIWGLPIVGRGAYRGQGTMAMDPETGKGERPSSHWDYAAQAAEVEVDPETGVVKVLKFVTAQDVGRAINPLSVEGQLQGCTLMGLASTLWEETMFDAGRVANPSFMDYLIPTAAEAPPMEAHIVEEPHSQGPYGAKGAGEAATVAVAPAIANAIYDAIGVRLYDQPLTPERVLEALAQQHNPWILCKSLSLDGRG